METPEAFDVMSLQFFDGFELVCDTYESMATRVVRDLSKEQKIAVKQFIDELLEAGDVQQAQKVWWASKADVCFGDDSLMKILRLISSALD